MCSLALGIAIEQQRTKNRWDNFKNTHWNSMGHLATVGHAKVLTISKNLTPPLGTITFPTYRSSLFHYDLVSFAEKVVHGFSR